MHTMVRRFFWWLALMSALLLVSGTARAVAAERVFIPASPDGPMTGLKNAGRSVNLLPSLEHENGDKLKPSEVRGLRGKGLYLPVDAVPDKAGRMAFVKEELVLFGPVEPKAARAAEQQTENKPQMTADTKAAELAQKPSDADQDLASLQRQLKTAKARIEELEDRFPWDWLLLLLVGSAIVAAVVWLVFRQRNLGEEDRILKWHERQALDDKVRIHDLNDQINSLNEQARILASERNQALQTVDRLTERLSIIQADKDLLNRNWDNIGKLQARIDELKSERGYSTGSSAGG